MLELLIALLAALQLGSVCDMGTEIDGREWAQAHSTAQGVALIGIRGDFEIMLFESDVENERVLYYVNYDGTRRHVECARLVELPVEEGTEY